MKTAELVRKLEGFAGDARLYRLSEPHDGHTMVVVSAVRVFTDEPETYIFPADETGKVTHWGELEGSFRGGLDHAQALRGAGYEVNS